MEAESEVTLFSSLCLYVDALCHIWTLIVFEANKSVEYESNGAACT